MSQTVKLSLSSGIYLKNRHIALQTGDAFWSTLLYFHGATQRGSKQQGIKPQHVSRNTITAAVAAAAITKLTFRTLSRFIKHGGGNIHSGIHSAGMILLETVTYSSTQQMIRAPLRCNQGTQFCWRTIQSYMLLHCKRLFFLPIGKRVTKRTLSWLRCTSWVTYSCFTTQMTHTLNVGGKWKEKDTPSEVTCSCFKCRLTLKTR